MAANISKNVIRRNKQIAEIARLTASKAEWEDTFDNATDVGKREVAKRQIQNLDTDLLSARRVLQRITVPTAAECGVMRQTNGGLKATVDTEAALSLKKICIAADALTLAFSNLREATQHGANAGSAAASLIRQLPVAERDNYRSIVHALALSDSSLASAIESDMIRFGIFSEIAPAPWSRQLPHNLPPMGEYMTSRFGKLTEAVGTICNKVNGAI
jgi:hypothetical protein